MRLSADPESPFYHPDLVQCALAYCNGVMVPGWCEADEEEGWVEQLASITEPLFNALVLIPTIGVHPTQRREFNPDAKLAELVVGRYEKRRSQVTWLWDNGLGHRGDRSAWEAYNGLVEAVDHDDTLFPSRSGVFRLGALMDGQLRKKKDAALNGLRTFAEADQAGRFTIESDAAEVAGLVLAK
jgi:hypothetical protein